jgi:hypothetical protein
MNIINSPTSDYVKMEKKGLPSWNVQLHHSFRHRSVEKGQHEPLICIVCLPLSCHRPWSLRGTTLVGDMERSLRRMQSFNTSWMGSLLQKFLEQVRALESMPSGMVRHLLRANEVGQVSCEDLGD